MGPSPPVRRAIFSADSRPAAPKSNCRRSVLAVAEHPGYGTLPQRNRGGREWPATRRIVDDVNSARWRAPPPCVVLGSTAIGRSIGTSTPELTIQVCGHVDASDQSDAINKMDGPPPVEGPSSTEQGFEAVAQKLNWLAQPSNPYLTMNPHVHVDAAEPSDVINGMNGPLPMERLSTTEHGSTAAEAVAQGVAQEFDAACLQMSTLDVGWLVGPAVAPESKPLPIQGLGEVCHPLSMDDQSSGGTRTPDTRTMIPAGGNRNPQSDNELENGVSGCCTNSCTSDCHVAAEVVRCWQKLGVFQAEAERPIDAKSDEFEPSICFIAKAWPALPPHIREAIMTLIAAANI